MTTVSGVAAGKAFVTIEAIDKTAKGLASAGKRLKSFGQSLTRIGKSMMLVGAAATLPIASAVKEAATLEEELLHMQIALGQTKVGMTGLIAKVRELGRSTSFTAQEVAQAGAELSRGGFNTNEVENSLEAVLAMSRVGRLELSQAAKIMIQSMRAFNIEAKDSAKVSDTFAVAAKNGATNIEELAQAMSFSGGTAAELGMSLEQVLAVLTPVSKQLLTSTKGGTSLNQFLLSLATQADKVKKKLGFELFDDLGNPRDALSILTDMRKVMKGMTKEEILSTGKELFNVRGARQFLAIAKGLDEVNEMMTKFATSAGEAKRNMDTLDAGIMGAIRKTISAFQDLKTSLGIVFGEVLVNTHKDIIGFLNSMSVFVVENKKLFLQLGAAITGLLVGGAGVTVLGMSITAIGSAITTISAGLAALSGVTLGALATVAIKAAAAITAISVAATIVYKAFQTTWPQIKDEVFELARAIEESFARITRTVWNSLSAGMGKISNTIREDSSTWADFFEEVLTSATDAIDNFTDMAVIAIPEIINGISELVSAVAKLTAELIKARDMAKSLTKWLSLGAADVDMLSQGFMGAGAGPNKNRARTKHISHLGVFDSAYEAAAAERKEEQIARAQRQAKEKAHRQFIAQADAHRQEREAKEQAAHREELARIKQQEEEKVKAKEIATAIRDAEEPALGQIEQVKTLHQEEKESALKIAKLKAKLKAAENAEQKKGLEGAIKNEQKNLKKIRKDKEKSILAVQEYQKKLIEGGMGKSLLAQADILKGFLADVETSEKQQEALNRIEAQRSKLLNLQGAISGQAPVVGSAIERGSTQAASFLQKAKAEAEQVSLLKKIDEQMEKLNMTEKRVLAAVSAAGGGSV